MGDKSLQQSQQHVVEIFILINVKKVSISFRDFPAVFSIYWMLCAFEVNSHSEVTLLNFPWEEKRRIKKILKKEKW